MDGILIVTVLSASATSLSCSGDKREREPYASS